MHAHAHIHVHKYVHISGLYLREGLWTDIHPLECRHDTIELPSALFCQYPKFTPPPPPFGKSAVYSPAYTHECTHMHTRIDMLACIQ